MQATALQTETPRRGNLASAGVFHFVCEFKRTLHGFPLWKKVVFKVFLKFSRFISTKLELPTVIRYDGKGAYWTEYRGGFSSIERAHEAIERMKIENAAAGIDAQFELTENIPMNGVLPAKTGRYLDQDYVGDYIPEFYQERTGPVMCPFKRTLCTPEEVISRVQIEPLFRAVGQVDAVLNQ